jgi:hypothetical protein
LSHKLNRSLVTDSANTGNVIRRITYQGQVVRDALGGNAKTFTGILDTDPMLFDAS